MWEAFPLRGDGSHREMLQRIKRPRHLPSFEDNKPRRADPCTAKQIEQYATVNTTIRGLCGYAAAHRRGRDETAQGTGGQSARAYPDGSTEGVYHQYKGLVPPVQTLCTGSTEGVYRPYSPPVPHPVLSPAVLTGSSLVCLRLRHVFLRGNHRRIGVWQRQSTSHPRHWRW